MRLCRLEGLGDCLQDLVLQSVSNTCFCILLRDLACTRITFSYRLSFTCCQDMVLEVVIIGTVVSVSPFQLLDLFDMQLSKLNMQELKHSKLTCHYSSAHVKSRMPNSVVV